MGDTEAEVSKKFDENLKFFGGAGRKFLFAALRADLEDRRFAVAGPAPGCWRAVQQYGSDPVAQVPAKGGSASGGKTCATWFSIWSRIFILTFSVLLTP